MHAVSHQREATDSDPTERCGRGYRYVHRRRYNLRPPTPSFVRRLWTDVWEIRTIKSLSSLYWYRYMCWTLGLTSHIAGMLLPKLCAGRLDRDPYWCRIWPSAIALAEEVCHATLCFPVHYLLQQAKEFNG
jgi:hypothetical protein